MIRLYVFILTHTSAYLSAVLVPYSEVSTKVLCYAKACKTFSYSPNISGNQIVSTSFLPDLFFRSIKESYSTIDSPSFVLNEGIVAYPDSISVDRESTTRFESFPLVLVQRNSSVHALRDPCRYSRTINKRVFVVGGSTNWYHFIFEILPKLYLVDKHFGEEPQDIIITRQCEDFPNFKAAIKLFSSFHTLILADSRQILRIKEAIIIDDFNIAPFELKSSLKLHPSDWKINSLILNEYATVFRGKLKTIFRSPSTNIQDKRIFLARKVTNSRRYNQDSLIGISIQYGFHIAYLEDYSLTEQCELIASTQYLVGPPGSAWASLIFSERPLTCLSWVPYGRFQLSSLYSTISQTLGHHMSFFYSGITEGHSAEPKDPYFVDPDIFELHLSLLLTP